MSIKKYDFLINEKKNNALKSQKLGQIQLPVIKNKKKKKLTQFLLSNYYQKKQLSNVSRYSNIRSSNQIKLTKTKKFITYSDIRIGLLICKGTFGNVYEAFEQQSGQLIAVKIIPYDYSKQGDKNLIQNIKKQIIITQKIQHPNLITIYGFQTISNKIYIYMQKIQDSISSIINQFGPFSQNIAAIYTKQILLILQRLHKQYIIHRDIKGANILIKNNSQVKVCDLGSIKLIQNLINQNLQSTNKCVQLNGTLYWMAPEIIKGQKYGRRVDIWSLGCTVIQMLTGTHPWSNCSSTIQLILKIETQKCPNIPQVSQICSNFILKCCTYQQKKRPYAWELLQHPFIKLYNNYNNCS